MKNVTHADKVYEKIAWSDIGSPGDEFDACTFINCNFAEGNLANCRFADCQFRDCNLGNAKVTNAALQNVTFLNCKIVGVDFSQCRPLLFAVRFENCCLDYAGFVKTRLKKTSFTGCTIKEADFTAADLTGAAFSHCDLALSIFRRTNLTQADFRTARHYTINPELNTMRQAKFSLSGIAGLLSQYDIVIE